MNKKISIGIVVCAIVTVVMFAGCIEEETPVSTLSPSPSPSPTPTPIPEPKYSPEDIMEEEDSEKPEWVTIHSFTNSDPWTKWSLTATDCFNIRGNKWRIKYTVEPHGVYESHEKDSLFKAIVFPRGEDMHSNTALYVSSFECNGQECSDTQYIYEGNGDYYIGVGSKLNIWVLEVEDYY